MGCCFSKDDNDFTNTPPPPQFPPPRHFQVPESDPHPSKAPLSPVFEEESVKEVLSETPKPKPEPKQSTFLQPKKEEPEKEEEDKKTPPTPLTPPEEEKKFEVLNQNASKAAASPEISEVSEICSLSESISTTLTERREDEDGEVVQQRLHRSPAKSLRKRPIPGDFGRHERGSKSPARRLNPSPARRNDNNEATHTARRRMSSETNRVKRDPNERSGRRSRSPATTRVNPGANRSSTGRSPSRRAPPPAHPPPPRSPARIPPPGKVEEEGESTNESIENPLVSLECFIFL